MKRVFRRALGPWSAFVAGVAVVAACASGGGAAGAGRVETREAKHAAAEHLPGVTLSGRHLVLGSELQVTATAPDSARARSALDAGFAAADSVEKLLDLHRAGSELNAINRAAGRQPVAISPWTEAVVAASLEWARRSDGAFDPTVGPILEVWGFGRTQGEFPDSAALAEARRHVGWDKVRYDPQAHTVFLPDSQMEFDMAAAAKGFALDRLAEALAAAGATSAIGDFEHDELFLGPGTQGQGRWPVALSDPYDPSRVFARLVVPPGAVSTSTPFSRVIVVRGERYGHLIDPRSGRPTRALAAVTVYAQNGMVSDILATALAVMGPVEGPRMIEQAPEADAIFVTNPPAGERSEVTVTSGLRPYLEHVEPPYHPLEREDR